MKVCFLCIVVATMALGATFGTLPDGEPVFQEHYRRGTIRYLKGRELLDALSRSARRMWFLRWAIAVLLLIIAAKLAGGDVEEITFLAAKGGRVFFGGHFAHIHGGTKTPKWPKVQLPPPPTPWRSC